MKIGFLVVCALLLDASVALGEPPLVALEQAQLTNGMALIVVQDRRAPVVHAQLWLRAGGRRTDPGQTGMAELVRRLLDGGADGSAPHARRITTLGGVSRTRLTRDALVLEDEVGAADLDELLLLQTRRLRTLTCPATRVRELVGELHHERSLANVDDRVRNQLFASAYLSHPYRLPLLGWPEDVAALDPAACNGWLRQNLSPAGAVLIVVGDVDFALVRRRAARTLGGWRTRAIAAPPVVVESTQQGLRHSELQVADPVARVALSYRAPGRLHEDHAALRVAAQLLLGPGGLLAAELCRSGGPATQVDGALEVLADASQLVLTARAADKVGAATLEKELSSRIASLAKVEMAAPVQRAQRQLEVDLLRDLSTPSTLATTIAELTLQTGEPRLINQELQSLAAVTPAQVQTAMQRYLQPARCTRVVTLVLPTQGARPAPLSTQHAPDSRRAGRTP